MANAIFLDDLTAKVDILKARAGDLEVILVDHNVINRPELKYLDPKVTRIIDHHQLAREVTEDADLEMTLETVGSCATLVLEDIWKLDPDFKVLD